MDKQAHGGKREGAGRHRSLEKRIKTSITLKPDDKKWLDSNLEKISDLIDKAMVLLRNKSE